MTKNDDVLKEKSDLQNLMDLRYEYQRANKDLVGLGLGGHLTHRNTSRYTQHRGGILGALSLNAGSSEPDDTSYFQTRD